MPALPNKEKTLASVTKLVHADEMNKTELLTAYHRGTDAHGMAEHHYTHRHTIELLYYLGGIIVFVGVTILLWQNWSTMGSVLKVIASLGSGLVLYTGGIFLLQKTETYHLASAMFLISGLILPMGLHVIFDQAGFAVEHPGTQTLVSGLLAVMFLGSYGLLRRQIFLVFGIIFGSWFAFAEVFFILGETSFFANVGDRLQLAQYVLTGLGAAYLVIAQLTRKYYHLFARVFFALGALILLTASFTLADNVSVGGVVWEILYPILTLGMVFYGRIVHRLSLLVFGFVFFIAYLLRLAAQYFDGGFGWPLGLIITGIVLVLIGYGAFHYMHRQAALRAEQEAQRKKEERARKRKERKEAAK